MTAEPKRIGVTLGEPCGIGPEIAVRSLSKIRETDVSVVVYGSTTLFEKTARENGLPDFWKKGRPVELKSAGPEPAGGIFPEEDRRMRAEAGLAALNAAAADCASGYLSALLTGPIDKAVVRTLVPGFTGHTEYLAEKAGVGKTLMLLDNTEIRVILLTNHIPLRDVARELSAEKLEQAVRIAGKAFGKWFATQKPRFAVAGVNPHAGEIVENPEEESILKPAIARLRKEGWEIEGPFAADSLFPIARGGKWDAIFSPYHDQALIAAKYPGLDKVVNISLGLPYLRVSPGHGVAYDIAGKQQADIRSFERALRVAHEGVNK